MESVRYLLDTHAFLWWIFDDPKLSKKARHVIANPRHEMLVSSASAWEISTKHRIGKLREAEHVARDILNYILKAGFFPFDITVTHAQQAGSLPGPHRDPFDRMLIAISKIENIPIITNDHIFPQYHVDVVW